MCIALSDLLPELQFHQHDRLKLSVALLLGVALAWGVTRLEAAGHAEQESDLAITALFQAHESSADG